MSQNYGALRVVRVRPPADAAVQERYSTGWLPEERLVHLLSQRETTIGRALSNDIILMDQTVSREHARLVWSEHGWLVFNLTVNNIVRVNGRPVPGGGSLALQPQDLLVLGSTMLQLIAPQSEMVQESDVVDEPTQRLPVAQEAAQPSPIPQFLPQHAPGAALPAYTLTGNNGKAHSNGHGLRRLLKTVRPTQMPVAMQEADWQRGITPPALEAARPLPVQPEPEQRAQPWDDEEEHLLGAGVTMQFALPQRMGLRTRWLIAGFGITVLVASTIITIVLNSLVGISSITQNGVSSIMAALIIPLLPALVINLLVNFIDRYEREPWFLRLAAFLWGALIAIPPALFIELRLDALTQSVPDDLLRSLLKGLNAGITEESVKGLGLLLLFVVLRDEFDNVTDGIVYGALIGAGFAMVENFVYFATNSRDFLVFLIVGRIVLGWLCHSTFTMCFGAALGYVRHTRIRWHQILVPLIGYLVAVGLHSVFDFVNYYANAIVLNDPAMATISLVAIIGNYIPPFIAQIGLLYILIKSLGHEAAVIREFLAPEVSSGVVQVDEYALLQNSFQRTREERRIFRRYGLKQWMRVKALYQTEIGLAFRKWHVSMGDKPKLGYRQPEDAYRRRITRLRHEFMNSKTMKQT
jgi:RsiW-degrading membrane proteinase PrsW (M82 family)/pSer/pThr/pTyr-binding forkhead associated (FHA) protein